MDSIHPALQPIRSGFWNRQPKTPLPDPEVETQQSLLLEMNEHNQENDATEKLTGTTLCDIEVTKWNKGHLGKEWMQGEVGGHREREREMPKLDG